MKKLCIDCKWYQQSFETCLRPASISNLIGEPVLHFYEKAAIHRSADIITALMEDLCGKRGRFWEARYK